ncbi:MAG: hypothetical protein R3C01_17325 [Planctomycetaceae bacterium]
MERRLDEGGEEKFAGQGDDPAECRERPEFQQQQKEFIRQLPQKYHFPRSASQGCAFAR